MKNCRTQEWTNDQQNAQIENIASAGQEHLQPPFQEVRDFPKGCKNVFEAHDLD